MAATGTETESTHLRRALELAEGGRGRVSPNPLVGAVIVRGGEVIGEGFHAELGGLHAERAALEDCRARGDDPAGATVYVTLEPCAHRAASRPAPRRCSRPASAASSTPPRTRPRRRRAAAPGCSATAASRSSSPNGAEAAAARLLNQPFRKRARTGRPLVTYKAAMTLDGRVAGARRRLALDLVAPRAASSSTAGARSATRSPSASAPRSPTTRC